VEKKSHERLDRYINERRLELGPIRLQEVARLAGISVPTLTALRKGTNVPTEDTKHGVERALQWAPGSIDRILAGGEPAIATHAEVSNQLRLTHGVHAHVTPAGEDTALDRTIEALARMLKVTPDEVRERMGIDERSTESDESEGQSEDYSRYDRRYERLKRDPGPEGQALRTILESLSDRKTG